jgi:hypothetical protein
VALDLDPQNGEAGLLTVEGDAFDQAGEAIGGCGCGCQGRQNSAFLGRWPV